jgi:hypothetical protein
MAAEERASTQLYFGGGRTGTSASTNDGALQANPGRLRRDRYTVDYATTSGKKSAGKQSTGRAPTRT